MIRVIIPVHLRTLAGIDSEMNLDLNGPVTVRSVLDAIEERYPMLRGTMRDQVTLERRPYIRFFAREHDISHEPTDTPLPAEVANGSEPLLIIGAIAGG